MNYTGANEFMLTEFITPISTGTDTRTILVQIQFQR